MENQLRCISHEIRNQISICELYIRIIEKKLIQKGIKDMSLDNAVNCIEKSLKLMSNSLLDLRSADNFNPKRADIKELLKNGINMSFVYSEGKDIEISLHCTKTCDIYIDENKFLACIVNIIKNATEAIDEKGKIDIFTDVADDKVSVKILNNGKPIKKGSDIFKEGFTDKKTGNGLGLAICKEYLEKQDAILKLNKSDESGTEFEIILNKY